MSKKDTDETIRQPKNLRVLESTAEALEEIAESRYGSRMKQGQVVDDLVAMYGDEGMLQLIKEIHEATVSSSLRSGSASTHTCKPSSQKSREGPVGELEDLALEGEAIDPEAYDLSVLKGVRGVDRAAIVVAALRGTGQVGWTQGEITDFVQKHLKLSRNGARNVGKEATFELVESPLMGLDSWVRDRVQQDIEDEYNNSRKKGDGISDWKYEDSYGSGFAEYTSADGDLMPEVEAYYVDESAMLDDLESVVQLVTIPLMKGVGRPQQRRSRNALCELGRRLVEYEASQDVDEEESPVSLLRGRVESLDEQEKVDDWFVPDVLAVVGE